MSSGLLSPRAEPRTLDDVGERSAFVAGQRVGRGRRRRRSRARGRARRGLRTAGLAGAVLFALAAPAGAAWWALTSPRFAVATIEVRGAERLPIATLSAAAGIAPGTNVWRIDPRAVAARLEALPEVRRADVVRELPNRVIVQVEERRPFTLVHGARLHWLDEDGWLLGEAREAVPPPAPVISGLSDDEIASLRKAPAARARAAVGLIRTLLRSGSALAAEISEIDMSRSEGPVLYTLDGIEVHLGSEDWADRLARLEGVLGQVANQVDGLRAIDLRYRDQVVLTRGGQG